MHGCWAQDGRVGRGSRYVAVQWLLEPFQIRKQAVEFAFDQVIAFAHALFEPTPASTSTLTVTSTSNSSGRCRPVSVGQAVLRSKAASKC